MQAASPHVGCMHAGTRTQQRMRRTTPLAQRARASPAGARRPWTSPCAASSWMWVTPPPHPLQQRCRAAASDMMQWQCSRAVQPDNTQLTWLTVTMLQPACRTAGPRLGQLSSMQAARLWRLEPSSHLVNMHAWCHRCRDLTQRKLLGAPRSRLTWRLWPPLCPSRRPSGPSARRRSWTRCARSGMCASQLGLQTPACAASAGEACTHKWRPGACEVQQGQGSSASVTWPCLGLGSLCLIEV